MAKKNTCPVCMTKMRLHTDGHTMVCPECGYKLCDHDYTDRDLYDTNHSHSDYTTYSASTTYNTTPARTSTVQTRPTNTVQKPAANPKLKKNMTLWLVLIVIYCVIMIFSAME